MVCFSLICVILVHGAKHSVMVFNVFLQVYSGGIGSYALLAMLIAFLKVKWLLEFHITRSFTFQKKKKKLEIELILYLCFFYV